MKDQPSKPEYELSSCTGNDECKSRDCPHACWCVGACYYSACRDPECLNSVHVFDENLPVKKYHVFSGEVYYANRFGDYACSFADLSEAEEFARKILSNDSSNEWCEILETTPNGSLNLVGKFDDEDCR